MSGLVWMFRISKARKLVWASLRVTDSLEVAMMAIVADEAVTVRQVSYQLLFYALEWARGRRLEGIRKVMMHLQM